MTPRLGTTSLVLRHVRSGLAGSVLVAILVAVTVLVVSLAPRALVVLSEQQLQHTLAAIAPEELDLTGTAVFGHRLNGTPATAAELFSTTADRLDWLPSKLSAPLAPLVGEPSWVLRTGQRKATADSPSAGGMLALAIDLDWRSRVDFVEGSPPVAWTGTEDEDAELGASPPIEIALSTTTAQQLGLAVGDTLDFSPETLRLSGVYEIRDPHDPAWIHAGDLAAGDVRHNSEGDELVYASAYIDPGSALGLLDTLAKSVVSVWYPLNVDDLTFADAAEARDQTRALIAVGGSLPSGESMSYRSELPTAVDVVTARVALVVSLLGLAVSGPLGVVLAVFALGAQSVLDRRRAALALVSARGADGTQLRALMVIEGLVIALPSAAAAAVAAALLVPVQVGADAYVLPAILTLALPVLFAISTSPGSLRPARTDLAVRARGGARWVIELATIGLAILALFLLFRRGIAQSGTAVVVDPLLIATPLLLSLAVCVGVLRLYPGIMLAVQRWSRSRPGAVTLVGAARAVRAPALGFAATLALIVGISIAVFSTTLSSTVSAALSLNAQSTTGADLRVVAPAVDASVVSAVSALDGVTGSAAIARVASIAVSAGGETQLVVAVLADFDQLTRVRPDLGLPPSGSGISFLASADLADFLGDEQLTVDGRDARVTAIVATSSLPIEQGNWILLDLPAAEAAGLQFAPKELLVALDPGVDHVTLSHQIDALVHDAQPGQSHTDVRVVDAAQLVAAAQAEPVVGGLSSALLLAALLTALLSVLAVVLASLSSAPVRNRLIGVLRILGMSPAQLRRIVAWELGPVALTAMVAGTLLGLAELWIVTAAVDLRPFLQGTVAATPSVTMPLIAAVVIGFALVVGLAGFVTTAIGRRLSPASSVKIGIE